MYRMRPKQDSPKSDGEDLEKRLSELPMMVPSRRPSTVPGSPMSPNVQNVATAQRGLPQGAPTSYLPTPPPAVQTPNQRIQPSWPMPLQPSSSRPVSSNRPLSSRPRPPPLSILPPPSRSRHNSQGSLYGSPRSAVRPGASSRQPPQQPSPMATHSSRSSASRIIPAPLPPLREESYDSVSSGGSSGKTLSKPAPWVY